MRVFGALGLAAVLALPVAAQQQAQPQHQQTPQERQSQQQREQRPVGTAGAMTTVEAIVDNPERFYNETVTIAGDVSEVYGKRAFDIREEGIIDVDDKLLVLSKKDLSNLTEDSVVQVRGKVRPFVRADLEREHDIDWNDYGFDADFFSSNERKPVLIAENVEVRRSDDRDQSRMERPMSEQPRSERQPSQQAQSGQQQPRQQGQVGTAGAAAAGAATIEAIADNPERFYNQTVTVSGEIDELHGKKAFNLQEEGVIDVDDKLLVLSKKDLGNLSKDAKVQVRGKVHQFVKADLERELGISDWNDYGFDANFFSNTDRKAVLIAESVDVRQSSERR
ncbi:MAG TPA: hypothetical protein VK911_16925 [Vicinamibacterales bacterium]|nr:hypothetical protein [Vicinamibacterales bacterium]